MAFDIEGARRAGYSDAEIADYLGNERGFKVRDARRAGYSDAEIVAHLSTLPPPKGMLDRAKDAVGEVVKGVLGGNNAIAGIDKATADRPASKRKLDPIERPNARPATERSTILNDPSLGLGNTGLSLALPAAVAKAANKRGQAIGDRINAPAEIATDGYIDRQRVKIHQAMAGIGSGIVRAVAADTKDATSILPESFGDYLTEKADNVDRFVNARVQGGTEFDDIGKAEGVLGKAGAAASFIAEEAPAALAYTPMLMSGIGTGALLVSQAGNIGQDRAENNGTGAATSMDILKAAPAAAASLALDKFGFDRILKGGGKTAVARIANAAFGEAGTEGVQSIIEYAGGALGTEKGFNSDEALRQAAAGALVGFGAGGGMRAGIEGYQGARRAVRVVANGLPQRPIAPGVRATANVNAATPTEADIASPIRTEDIVAGRMDMADAEGKASADSILRAAGMPTTGTRVNVRMPDGTVRTGTMADAFMTDAGEMGIAAGLAINLEDGTIFTEHFETLNDAGVTVTAVDAAADANAEFDAVVNAAAQENGVGAPGSGMVNPPALPAPAQQPKGNRGTPVADGVAVAKALFPKARITSGYRAPDHALSRTNPNSWHTKSHAAVDMAPIPGMTFEQARQTFVDAGYTLIEALNETGSGKTKHATGDHWHFVIGTGTGQQGGNAPRATSAPVGGESVQDDMFGGPSLTESQIAARENVGRVLDEAVAEDDRFELRKAARELEAARVDFEASGQGKFSDYVEQSSSIPLSLRQAIDANPNLLPLVLQRAGIEDAAANVAAPTEAQKEAGNYRKGHVRLHGLDITIETPRGAERSGTDPDGKAWSVAMPDHYGYVKRTEGADGEQVDVYVGPNPESDRVYLIDQNDADTGQFDEHKAMLGYRSSTDALDAYHAAFDDGRGGERMGNVVEMSAAEFKQWLATPQTAPAGETIRQGTTGTGAEAPASEPEFTLPPGISMQFSRDESRAGLLERTGSGPLTFPSQREAAMFIRANSLAGHFEIAVHPDGGFGVRRRLTSDESTQAAQEDAATERMVAWDRMTPEERAAEIQKQRAKRNARKPVSERVKDIPDDILGPVTATSYDAPTHPETGAQRLTLNAAEIASLREHGIEIDDNGNIDADNVEVLQAERARRIKEQGEAARRKKAEREAAAQPSSNPDALAEQNTNGPQDGGVAPTVEAPQAGGPEATADSNAVSADGVAPSSARVEDTGTGKSVAIIGASEAELAAVAKAIPNAKALPPRKSDGGVVYSKKYEAKIGEALAGFRRTAEAEARKTKRRPLTGKMPQTLDEAYETLRQMASGPKIDDYDSSRNHASHAMSILQERGQAEASRMAARTLETGQRLNEYEQRAFEIVRDATPDIPAPKVDKPTPQTQESTAPEPQKTAEKHAETQPQPATPAKPGGRRTDDKSANPYVKTGERYTLTRDVDYLSAGGTYEVEKTTRTDAWFRNVETGGRTSVKNYMLQPAMANGLMVPAEAETATPTTPFASKPQTTLGYRADDTYTAADVGGLTEGLAATIARTDNDPGAQETILDAIERGLIRDGDMLVMGNPRWALERGYADIGPVDGTRRGRITEAGRAKLAELRGQSSASETQKTAPEAAKPATKSSAPGTSKFAGNKLFTEDKVAAARARLKDKLNRLNAGIDPELLMDGIVLAGAHIEAGVRKFADLARTLADHLGSDLATLKPYLRAWYNGARDMLEDAGEDVSDMDGPGAVKAALTMIEDMATTPAESAISPTENSNVVDAERGQTEANDRGGAEGARSEGLPAGQGERDAGRDSGEPSGSSDADVRADDGGRGTPDRESGDAGRPASRAGKRKQSGTRNGDNPGNRVRRDKPARSDGGVNFYAPVGSLKREGGWKTTAARNLDIIELVNRLTAENRQATPDEQALLAKWTGWGAGEIRNNLFKNIKRLEGGGRAIVPPTWGEWKDIGERAALLLQGDALETALQSTQYAHYTSEGVIRSIWKGLERLGFTGGKILEPGMGSGLFAVAAPKAVMEQSSYTGIEMDAFTAKVGGFLLPSENVIAADFVKQKLPNGFFDVAIGNPPFANIAVTDDPVYRRYRFSLHDYFFAKSIDKVRPGGLMVFVTSRYTMDKLDRKAREYIAERADLLGAVRLPQTAFKENAGTEVVTDVLFFQRRAPGTEMGGKDWLSSEPIAVGNESIPVNSYYAQHPEMVLGRHATTGSMYRKNEYTVEPLEGDIEDAFAKAIEKLPERVFIEAAPDAARTATRKTFEADMIPAAEKEGGLYLKDGALYIRQDGVGIAFESTTKLNSKEKAWAVDYVPLRDAVKEAQRDQLQDGPWEKSLAKLNKLYDAFVKKHGPISAFTTSERIDQVTADEGEAGAYYDKKEGEWVKDVTRVTKRFTNRRRLRFDVESTLVEALEKISDDGKIGKGPFLLDRTIDKPKRGKVESASDAVAVTLDEIGRFDPDYAAQLRGVSVPDLIGELGSEVYQTPDGAWTLADEYLSGDVVAKLEEAQAAAAIDPRFERNVTALVKVQPKPLAYADISVRLGAGWIEPSVIEQFAEEVLDDPIDGLIYEPATGIWTVPESRRRTGRSASSEYATEDRSARELLDAVLNNRTIKITRKDSDKKTYTDQEATALANERAKKIGDKFKSWVWTDSRRAQRLSAKYNRLFNNLAPRKFDGSHLSFPGLSTRYKLYDHQRRAIWRVIATGNTYLNHAVGAGKTLEMIVSAMEQRRLGLVRKPMFVVPNHMLNQFAREFLDAYPAANLMVADEHAFQTDNRRRFMAKAALNDPDAIIVPHSSLVKIGTLEATRQAVVDRFIGELEEAMKSLEGDTSRHARKNVENQIERIKRQFAGKADAEAKDRALTFEEMGVDFLYVDEAHEFRKLDFATNRTSVKGIDANGSKRALDLYIKLLWLNEQRPGRAAVLASGTPVTNTMAEIYTVMRYMDQAGLERDGLAAFDAWAANFGEVVPGFEQNAAGGYEIVERFSKFVNVPELMKRVRTFMDVLTSPQLGDLVKRPDVVGGGPQNVVAQASDELNAYMKGELATRIQASRKWKPSKDQPNNPDPLINIITDGRLSAIDMRFVDNTAPNDPGSKLNLMIDRIIEKARAYRTIEFTDPKTGAKLPRKGATQIVFSAVGFGDQVAKNRGFDARAWVDKRLAEAGITPAEIAWMGDQNTHAKKEATFKAMRNAEVTTLLGSPKNMGTGVNVQLRLKALHYLSPPWYPSDVEQPHGRIIRQGNLNGEVEIYWYATKGTYDSTGWQMVSRKAKFIEQAMSGDETIRSIEDISEANQYEMASALAAGDERAIQLAGLSGDIERLTKLRAAHADEQVSLGYEKKRLERAVASELQMAANYAAAIEARGENGPFAIRVDRISYDRPGEAGGAMIEAIDKVLRGFDGGDLKTVEVGRYRDNLPINLTIEMRPMDGGMKRFFDLSVQAGPVELMILGDRRATDSLDPVGISQRIQNAVRGIDNDRRELLSKIERYQAEQVKVSRKLGAPFEYEADLADRVAERARLEGELAAETAAAQKAMDEAAKVKEDSVLYEAIAEDGGQEYEGTDDDPTDPDGPGSGASAEPTDLRGEGSVQYDGEPADFGGAGRSERADAVSDRRAIVRGLGVAAEIKRTGHAALVGREVSHPADLAELAQVYRDPRYETFRVFFLKDGKIVHASGYSSRMTDRAPLIPGHEADPQAAVGKFAAWVNETMGATGADGYYMLHNHPSGVPEPSPADKGITAAVNRLSPGLLGHVIINTTEYGFINAFGKGKRLPLPDRFQKPDALTTPVQPHPIIGQPMASHSQFAAMAKDVQRPDYVTIIGTSAIRQVRIVADIPRAMFDRPDVILLGALRRIKRLSGAVDLFMVGNKSDLDHRSVRKAYDQAVLFDAMDDSGRSLMAMGMPRSVKVGESVIDNAPGIQVAEERAAFDNGETERRFQEAKAGLATTQTFRERIAEGWEKAWHGISRHWIALPNEPRYAALQEKLRAIEAAPQSARERTIRMLDDMVKDFTDADLDLFTRKVILDDLAWDAANERDLPFGFTTETLRAEKAKVDQLVKAQPDQRVHKAAMKRKLVNRKIAQELVDAGVLEAEQIKNPAYYRHQVLEYARAQTQYARTPGKKLRTPKWAKRMGSTLDINANLLEAEFDWLNKAFIDIPVAKTIEWIKNSEHNILDTLKKQAKASNDEGVQRELNKARELLDENESGPEVEEAMALIEQEKGFRQSIAMGFDYVRAALRAGEIKVPARFEAAAAGIENGKGSTSEPPFSFLSWMLDSDQPGAMGAAMVMKAISQRRVWTKNLLGRDYIDPQNAEELVKRLAPEGYRTWQPDEGKLLFTVKTLPEHVIDGMIEKLETVAGIDQTAFRAALEGARSALAMGGDRYTMILPQEVADTLSQLRREEIDGLFDHFIKEPVKAWKRWVLVNPRRFFKYNINNISGDLDAVIAGNPRSLRRIGVAGRELFNVMTGKAKASDRYNEAVARGVFDSGLSVQEIPDIHKLEPFERFAKKPGPINKITVLPLRKAWAALQGATQWRENVMRYAAYLDYVERIEAGESQKSIGYGASRPDMVDAVVDPKDRAALLARDLLGDYGAISHYGGWLRQTIIPFWSWTEINTKRYWRLTANAYSEGIGRGVATGSALAAMQGVRTTAWLALRMAMLYGLFSLWNGLFFPDEEDELGEAQNKQMHVILGRNAEGEIISMRAQGALSDALSWFGLADIGKAARNYDLGRGSLVDVINPLWQTPVNKIATSLSPVITVPVESWTGRKAWPNVFDAGFVRDPWRNLMQTVSLENEYDMVQGLPSRGYGRSWQESFIYRRDPGEIAYNEGRGIAYDWLKREKGQEYEGGFSSPRGNAARDYRTALRYGDQEAASKALDEMVKLGVDAGDFNAMIKRAAPLGPIAKKDQTAFIEQLTDDERATMVRAQEWYNTTFLGR